MLKFDCLLVIGSGEIELLVFELKWLDSLEDEENSANGLFSSEFDANENSTANELQISKKAKLNEVENGLIGTVFIQDENSQANVNF